MPEPRFGLEAQARAAQTLARWKTQCKASALGEVRDDLQAVILDRARPLPERLHALLCRRGVDHQLARYAAELYGTSPQGEAVTQIGPSIIRTVVPLLVQLVVAQLAKHNVDPGPYQELIAQVVGAVVAAAYYGAVRLLETYVMPRLGILLGSTKKPTYEAPAKPAPASPTGYVATEDAPAPEGDPVTVEPLVAPAQPMADTKADAAYHGRHEAGDA